jgi:hypothetical protein
LSKPNAEDLTPLVRGHLIFTDVMNHSRLGPELRRTRRAVVCADVLMAAVLTICVAVGIALASILMGPATTSAVFGEM